MRATYEQVLDGWEEHLRRRLGATRVQRPHLPIIPLGVDTDIFRPASVVERQSIRAELNIPRDSIVILWVGRFSHAIKSNPIPAYVCLEELSQRIDAPVVYLQAGWFADQRSQQAFAEAARRWSPSVTHIFLDGRNPIVRKRAWHASDIFLSLSDNFQETFGLTPIEAMAAGLPVVVSDWDGYRDTVQDGITGFRIPTYMPRPGFGQELARQFCSQTLSYEQYCGATSQSVAIDSSILLERITQLSKNEDLRKKMGQAGRRRALECYDWPGIINDYRQLISELAERRISAQKGDTIERRADYIKAPLRGDPYLIFNSYPTCTIGPETIVTLRKEIPGYTDMAMIEDRLTALHTDTLNELGRSMRLDQEASLLVISLLKTHGNCAIRDIAMWLGLTGNGIDEEKLTATIGWLLKIGTACISNP